MSYIGPKRNLAAIALALCLSLTGCDVMGGLIIAREVTGRLERNDLPAADVQLKRRWHWHLTDETGEQATRTGPDGRFSLPAEQRRKPLWAFFPHEPVIRQEFLAEYDGRMVTVMICSRRRYGAERPDRCAPTDDAPYKLILDPPELS